MKRYIALVTVCAGMTIGCGPGPETAPPAVNVQPSITGKLLGHDGVSPATGALVTMRPSDATAPISGFAKKETVIYTTRTTSDGTFGIDSCAAGVYAIEGAGADGNAVRIDSVKVIDPEVTTALPASSLKSTGAISGSVALINGGDPSYTFVLAFGSDRFVQVHSDGAFQLNDLPYGNYSLQIVCVLPDCGISRMIVATVNPGDTTEIAPVTLETKDLGAPKNFTHVYDSLKLAVNLRWESSTATGVKGYNVYRYDTAESNQYPLQPLNSEIIDDECSFCDSSPFTDISYVYGVAAVFPGDSIGRKAGPLVVTTRFGGCRIDMLTSPHTNYICIVQGISWDDEDRLKVLYSGPGGYSNLGFKYYTHDLEFDRMAPLTMNASITGRPFEIDGDRIFFSDFVYPDSAAPFGVIQCYYVNSDFHYTINLPTSAFAVSNDTLFATTYDPTTYDPVTAAYDTTGKMLYVIDSTGTLDIHHASNGKLYSINHNYYGARDDIVVRERLFPSMESEEIYRCVGMGGWLNDFDAMDANGGLFVFYNRNKFYVISEDGELVARARYSSGFYYPRWSFNSIAIDSRGRIAIEGYNDNVMVLTLPSDSGSNQ